MMGVMVMMMMMVLVVVVMVMRMMLSYSLTPTTFLVLLFHRVAERLPLLLIPGAQTLAAPRKIFVIDNNRFHPGAACFLAGHVYVREIVILRILVNMLLVRRGCCGNHFERRWPVMGLRGRGRF